MKYNLFYLLVLCSLLLVACQHDTDLGNETNPDYENEEELQEVSFSFSFDTSANMEIEYEPMTRADGEEEDWVRISNTFFYIIKSSKTLESRVEQYTIVKTGKAKFNSKKSDDDYVYLPEELDCDWRIYLPLGTYRMWIYTGANAVEFNENLEEGYSYIYYHDTGQIIPEDIPFAIRYKPKKTHGVRYCEEIFAGTGWEPDDNGIVYLEDYLLDEILYSGEIDNTNRTLRIEKNYFNDKGKPHKIKLSPIARNVRGLLQLPETAVLEEWNPGNEAMVACFEIDAEWSMPGTIALGDGIDLSVRRKQWYYPERTTTRRLYYYIDPKAQTGSDGSNYLTGSPNEKIYYLGKGGSHRTPSLISATLFPAGLMELYNPGYADYTTEAKPVAPCKKLIGSLHNGYGESVYKIQKKEDDDNFELIIQTHPFYISGSGGISQSLFPRWHDYYNPENK